MPLLLSADILPFQTIEKANKAYEKGDYSKSAKLFRSLDKDDPTVAYDEANAHYKAEAYDKALESYKKSKGIDEATRQYNMGNAYFKKDNLDLAIKSYKESLKIRDDEDTRYNLELAKRKKEQKKKEQKKKNNQDKKKNQDKKENKKEKEEQKKKKGQEKEKSEKKKSNEQQSQKAEQKEQKEKMSAKEKLTKKELKRLMKKLNEKRMPTMMYQTKPPKERKNDTNPW
jgi:Ca-activated chloride channel family protein